MRTCLTWLLVVTMAFPWGTIFAQSPADDDPGMADYWRFKDPDTYGEMMRESHQQSRPLTVADMADLGMDIIRMSENDWGGVLRTALRNLDDAAKPGEELYKVGKLAELLDLLNRSVKVYDEYHKGDGKQSYEAAVLAGRELAKMVVGNKAGGFVVAMIMVSKGPLIPAVLLGYLATKVAEKALDESFAIYDTLRDRSRHLSEKESEQRTAKLLKRGKDSLNIPDSADLTLETDERGGQRWISTWTDERTGVELSHVIWVNEDGHEVGSDFGPSTFINAQLKAMGGNYKLLGQVKLGDFMAGRKSPRPINTEEAKWVLLTAQQAAGDNAIPNPRMMGSTYRVTSGPMDKMVAWIRPRADMEITTRTGGVPLIYRFQAKADKEGIETIIGWRETIYLDEGSRDVDFKMFITRQWSPAQFPTRLTPGLNLTITEKIDLRFEPQNHLGQARRVPKVTGLMETTVNGQRFGSGKYTNVNSDNRTGPTAGAQSQLRWTVPSGASGDRLRITLLASDSAPAGLGQETGSYMDKFQGAAMVFIYEYKE